MIRIQHEDFSHEVEYNKLREKADGDGAIVTFTGLVRDINDVGNVASMFIEHYPGMTEKSLMQICLKARKHWELGQLSIIHRIGHLHAREQIVFIGVTSTHRKNAFEASQFIMDYLKKSATLWKSEVTASGKKWVESKTSDAAAFEKWFETNQIKM